MMRSTAQLSELVWTERNRRGLSLREAQDSSGVSFNTIARIELGKWPKRTLGIVARLADWCGYDVVLAAKNSHAATPQEERMEGLGGMNVARAQSVGGTRAPAKMYARVARNGYVLEVSPCSGAEPELWIAASAGELGRLVQSILEAAESALSSRGEP